MVWLAMTAMRCGPSSQPPSLLQQLDYSVTLSTSPLTGSVVPL